MAWITFNIPQRNNNDSAGMRIASALFFLIFFAVGVFSSWLIIHTVARTLDSRRWPSVSCTILRSEVVDEPEKHEPFSVSVRYAYDYNGRHYISDHYQRTPQRESNYRDAAEIIQRFPAGRRTTCRVNPADPSQAILRPNSLWIGLAFVVPLVFLFVGGGGIYFSLRPRQKTPKPLAPTAAQKRWGQRAIYGFFTIFLLIGLGGFWGMGRNALQQWSAADWPATPARVIWSKVRSHSGNNSQTTYSVDIFYSYEVNGHTYKSNRYRFMGGSSSGHKGKEAVVRRYPPGTTFTVYVDPADPTQAVIDRSAGYDLLLPLIPLVFAAIGAGGLGWCWRHSRRKTLQPPRNAWLGHSDPPLRTTATIGATASKGPFVLRAKHGVVFKFIFFAVFTLAWNGILSVFVLQVLRGWQSGHPDVFMTIFLIPFVAVGLGSFGLIGHAFSALFNPRVVLTLGQQELSLGDSTPLTWMLTGRYDKVKRLTIRLEGRESATYSSGKSTRTDTSVFANTTLVETSHDYEIRKGSAQLAIPAGTMHSFVAKHNQIVWVLIVQGEVPRRADVREEFPITIRPLPVPQDQPFVAEAR